MKIPNDSYRFYIVESECDNQIAVSPSVFNEKRLNLYTTILNKTIKLVFNYNINSQIMQNIAMYGILTTKIFFIKHSRLLLLPRISQLVSLEISSSSQPRFLVSIVLLLRLEYVLRRSKSENKSFNSA